MSDLPDDLVIAFASQLKQQSVTNSDLLRFTLVCKRWHQLGHHVLYRNVALSDTTVERFAALFNAEKYGDRIRSLSVQLGQDIRDESTDSWTYDTSLERRLNSIIPVISKCTNLASFSLRIEGHSTRSIPRPRIVALLNSLPDTCRNLEFDTRGQDYADEMEYAHVCDAIRRLLPRLQHARIRLATMCTTMFGGDDVKTIALPKLKSLVVNFGSPHDMQTAHCDQDYEYDYIEDDEEEEPSQAFPSCAGALVNLTHNLKQAEIYAVLGTSVSQPSCVQTILRSDCAKKETWAFPSMYLGSRLTTGAYLMRLHNGEEIIMNSMDEVERFAEGQIWRTAIGGTRLPADVLEAEDSCMERSLPAMAFDKWKHEDHIRRPDMDNKRSYWDWDLDTVVTYPRPRPMSFEKWRQANPKEGVSKQLKNEELVGMKLVKAEIRRGDNWLEGRPIVENTPGGWRQNGYGILQKI